MDSGTHAVDRKERRSHVIDVAGLIIHKYDDHDAVVRKAKAIAREIIIQNLRNGEFVRTTRKGRFEVFMPSMTPEAGSLRCAVISEQIAREIRDINPGSIALDARAEDLISRREAAREQVRPLRPEPAPPEVKPHAVEQDQSEQEIAEARRLATMALQAMLPTNRMRLEELLGGEAIARADRLGVGFEPIWHVKERLVTAYRCHLNAPAHEAPSAKRKVDEAQRDATLLLCAQSVLAHSEGQPAPALVVMPVHLGTLLTSALTPAYMEALSAVPDEVRRLLVFEVLDIPDEISRYRLREALGYLRGRCRSMIARVSLGFADFPRLKNAGFFGVSFRPSSRLPDQHVMRTIERALEAAERARLRTAVDRVARTPLMLAAMAAGVDYMSGPAVIRSFARPAGVRPVTFDAVYTRAPRATQIGPNPQCERGNC